LETKTLLIPIMSSGSAKSPAEGLKDSECKRGVITTRPPIPYVAAVDPYEKAEKTAVSTYATIPSTHVLAELVIMITSKSVYPRLFLAWIGANI
jgi:hypothetical protein